MARLPQVSGKGLIKFLETLGYCLTKRKGTHAAVRLMAASGEYAITFRDDPIIAKRHLNEILCSVSAHVGMPYDRLLTQLKETIKTDDGIRIPRGQLTEAEEAYVRKLELIGLRPSSFLRYADGSLSFSSPKIGAGTSRANGAFGP